MEPERKLTQRQLDLIATRWATDPWACLRPQNVFTAALVTGAPFVRRTEPDDVKPDHIREGE